MDQRVLFVVAALFATSQLFASARQFIRATIRPVGLQKRFKLPRLSFQHVLSQTVNASLGLLVGAAFYPGWKPITIGVAVGMPWQLCFAAGAGMVIPYQLFLVKLARLQHSKSQPPVTLQYLYARGRLTQAWSAFATTCVIPVYEEFLYRGVLIFQLGDWLNAPRATAAVGVLIHLGVHLHQGTKAMPSHVVFAVIVIMILFSPAGLIGSLGFHCGYNAWIYFTLADPALASRMRDRRLIVLRRLVSRVKERP